jgi:hypothetical protein
MSTFVLPSFFKDTPNKIGSEIDVSGKNTLIKSTDEGGWLAALIRTRGAHTSDTTVSLDVEFF